MYGQGNYAPQFGQGHHSSMPPFQQRPPPPPFQQGPPAPRPPIIQQGLPSLPPHMSQQGPPVYQHHPPVPVQQGPPIPVPSNGMLNSGQTYLSPPPLPPAPSQVHGSNPIAHSYPTARQNAHWSQNVHHIRPPIPPPLGPPPSGSSCPEKVQAPQAPRVLPSPSSQGQTLYRGPVHQPPPHRVQGLQHLPLPPSLPSSSFFIPAPYGSFVQSTPQDSHMHSMDPPPPPPPPSSPPGPPPLPPASPPPTSTPCSGTPSSTPPLTSSDFPHHSQSGLSSNECSGFQWTTSDSTEKVLATNQISNDGPTYDDQGGGIGSEEGSRTEDGFPAGGNLKLDLHPPPPKPTEEKTVRKIEVLCRFIAKNGPDFEDMTRQKEFGNPEFNFLFGGEPGTEAAAAHEYFVWMKKKCNLECKLHEVHEHRNSPLRPSGIVASMQPDGLINVGVSCSPADSDMDMEDDITQPDEEQCLHNSFESLNHGTVISNELNMKEQLHAPQSAAEHNVAKDAVSEIFFDSGTSGLIEQVQGPKLPPDHDYSTFGKSFPKVESSVMNRAGAAECNSDGSAGESSNPHPEGLRQSNLSVAAAGSSEKVPSQLIKGTSPFRLLQDYASDDSSENDDERCLEEVSPLTVSPSVKADATSLDRDVVYSSHTDPGSKNLLESERRFGPLSESVVAYSMSMPSKSLESSIESHRVAGGTDTTPIATGTADELDNTHGNQESINSGTFHKAFHRKNDLGGGGVPAVFDSVKSQKEVVKDTSTPLKVDEFGRLLREGASDSDSDDSRYTRRRGKRGRSCSRSQSPRDRRRRSPWRRKEKRSRSRSWSPKKRRSRSRSPFRRRGDLLSDKMRRDKGQPPGCFDFLRGKCYRGAVCRYLHDDLDKRNGSRHYRSKQQYQEVPPNSKSSAFHEGLEATLLKKSAHEHGEVKSQEMQLLQHITGSSFGASKDENSNEKDFGVSVRNGRQPLISDQDGESLVTDVAESERSRVVTAQVQDIQNIKEELVQPTTHPPDNGSHLGVGKALKLVDTFPAHLVIDAVAENSLVDNSRGGPSSTENLELQKSQAYYSDLVLQNADHQSRELVDSCISDSSPVPTSASIPTQLPTSEPHFSQMSSVQSYASTSSMSKQFSSEKISSQSNELSLPIPHHTDHLPPPLPSLAQGTNAPFMPQPARDHNLMPSTAKFPFHSAVMENHPPYQASLPYQHSHFSAQPSSSWNSIPPPPPYFKDSTVNAVTAPVGVPSLQLQHNLPPRNDFPSQPFVRHYPTEPPTHSQISGIQHHTYPSTMDPDLPVSDLEDFRSRTLAVSNPMSQPFGGPSLVGEDHFMQRPVQGLMASNSFTQANMHPLPLLYSRESPSRGMQSFSGENLRPGELHLLSSRSNPHLQQPSYSLQHSAADSFPVHLGEPGKINSTMSRYMSDFERNQPSRVSDFGASRISSHYNPYASTFDQPLSSKFSLNVFNQEKDKPYGNKYGALFSLNQFPVDGQSFSSLGSRKMTSSPTSARVVEQILPRSGGDQYDPLFDSIEPSSNSFKKSDHGQKRETTEHSDIMLRLSGSHKPLDVEENNKQRESGAVAITTSLENDEFGETADAEVGAVENESPSNEIDEANTATGEIEIDQVKTPGNSKKSKDSRSMRLFKITLADFVKEVLKPSWRQGNMSKEAFKTIVKKTVDKVSGAMKSHHIPKSQAKINQYIDSSQRKLTKLVMGYVDKYVKV